MFAVSVHARGFAHSHVNAAGPQRPLEPVGSRPLCRTVHGHCLGETHREVRTPDGNMLV